jgi:hypothetical protein
MNKSREYHSFHIPVMGLAFTVDTPVKVAKYGISSVMSIVDDFLIEQMREIYCKKINIPYEPITVKTEDYRAKRITAYLNLIDRIVKDEFEEYKTSLMESDSEIDKYIQLLPDDSEIKVKFNKSLKGNGHLREMRKDLIEQLEHGSIDVNIMTKLDNQTFKKNEPLPTEYNHAHAALRGFANSDLESSIVLSAGMNPRLYGYFEKFEDFFPDENLKLKKKIILKVSDYRSAIIQGKFLAKKGLWISEYRIESGLNCGGHAFATDGYLMGPILEEFKNRREELTETTYEIYKGALINKNRFYPEEPFELKITAQGGVGTSDEHNFLIDYYNLNSVGWGTPFLLVPEATNVDEDTLNVLAEAKEKDLYISKISPMGIPFNSVRGSSKDIERIELASQGKPGSSCPKKFLTFNTEYTERNICTASRQYQDLKLAEIKADLQGDDYTKEYQKIVDKTCLCTGLASSSIITNDGNTKLYGSGVLICPGPNLAYFSKTVSLKDMVEHIYGRINISNSDNRPNMFNKELKLYLDYLEDKIEESSKQISEKEIKYFMNFTSNLEDGIEYYKNLFSKIDDKLRDELAVLEEDLKIIKSSIPESVEKEVA